MTLFILRKRILCDRSPCRTQYNTEQEMNHLKPTSYQTHSEPQFRRRYNIPVYPHHRSIINCMSYNVSIIKQLALAIHNNQWIVTSKTRKKHKEFSKIIICEYFNETFIIDRK